MFLCVYNWVDVMLPIIRFAFSTGVSSFVRIGRFVEVDIFVL